MILFVMFRLAEAAEVIGSLDPSVRHGSHKAFSCGGPPPPPFFETLLVRGTCCTVQKCKLARVKTTWNLRKYSQNKIKIMWSYEEG